MGVSASTIKSAITMAITIPTTVVNANIFSFILLLSLGQVRSPAHTGSPSFQESNPDIRSDLMARAIALDSYVSLSRDSAINSVEQKGPFIALASA